MELRYATNDDFEEIYKLYNAESRLIGPAVPHAIKERILKNECLVVIDDDGSLMGACNFHILYNKPQSSIYEIAVWDKYRRRGIAKKLVYFVIEKYNRPVQAKCISGSISEDFWSSIGTKLREEQGRKKRVAVYQVGTIKKQLGLLDLM